MQRSNTNLFPILFAAALLVTLLGAGMKLTHSEYASTVLFIGLSTMFGYIIVGIYEINSSKNFDRGEKIMWTVGFIFFSTITAIVYLLYGRKKAFINNNNFSRSNEL